jgi:hypothetical protein
MNALLAWSLSQGANALSVIAGIIVAHLASPYEFARFATLSASLAIMSAVLNPIINEIAQRIALHQTIELRALRSRTGLAVLACCIIALCACATIVTNPFEALSVYLLIPASLVGHSWATGIFFGLHRMVAAGAVLCASGFIRVITLLALIYLGATFIGVTVSYLAGFIITISASRFLLAENNRGESTAAWTTNWKLICGFLLLALPFSVDQPIVHALFPSISADYAALMTYCRSVMLLASPALTLVYSASLQREASQHHSGLPTPRSPLALASALAVGLASILWLVHPLLFPMLLGRNYMHVTPYIALAILGMALYVISYFLIQQMLLSCRWGLCIALAIPPIIQAGLFNLLPLVTTPSLALLTGISVVTFAVQCLLALAADYLKSSRGDSKR